MTKTKKVVDTTLISSRFECLRIADGLLTRPSIYGLGGGGNPGSRPTPEECIAAAKKLEAYVIGKSK